MKGKAAKNMNKCPKNAGSGKGNTYQSPTDSAHSKKNKEGSNSMEKKGDNY